MTDTEQTVEQTDTDTDVEAAQQVGEASDEQVPQGELADTPDPLEGGSGTPEGTYGAKDAPDETPDEGSAGVHDEAPEQEEVADVRAKRDEYLALAQRTQADFENYRKRVARDARAAQTRGVISLAKEMLPALDNLDRALEAAAAARADAGRADNKTDADARARVKTAKDDTPTPAEGNTSTPAAGSRESQLLDGVRLLRSELSAALARVGIESFSPLGEAFDPALHEAMAQQPVEDAVSGTVTEVYQPGYRLGESVIRPARVVVAA